MVPYSSVVLIVKCSFFFHLFIFLFLLGMVHSVSGWTRGVQVKLWDLLRTRAILERLRGVFTTRRYTNPRLPLPLSLPLLISSVSCHFLCSLHHYWENHLGVDFNHCVLNMALHNCTKNWQVKLKCTNHLIPSFATLHLIRVGPLHFLTR